LPGRPAAHISYLVPRAAAARLYKERSMNALRLAVAGALVLALACAARAEEKASTKDKLVGVWEVTKGDSLPVGAKLELTKDGKIMLVVKVEEKTIKLEGTYKVEGDKKFKATLKQGGKESTETLEITKLTDKELVIKDEKGKVDSFKKSK
jgi:uncharacterized protein (TIGR03066 family)